MQIIQIDEGERAAVKPYKPTAQELNQEHNFLLAKEMTGKLLGQGLISSDEYEKIMTRSRASFLPAIASLYDE